MKRATRLIIVSLLPLAGALYAGRSAGAQGTPENAQPSVIVNTENEPIASGKFQPTWSSLRQYELPDWFRNAKFGIWAHWGPQCQPEDGDWYARGMYQEGSEQYKFHLAHYGHPSAFGFKDVINTWKAEKWDPDKLVKLYKRVGAQYFFALANHHDNFDLWDSKYQPWNSVNVGPKRDLIAGWAKAARDNGLPFGVSVHAAHAWSWYEVTQGADKTGDKAGVPYDGKLARADGAGKWRDGLDPQDLYAQNHTPSPDFEKPSEIHRRWSWGNGVTQPDQAYCDKFYNRTADLINRYHPDLLYFDDTALPLWPVSDAGLKIAAHFYNSDLARHDGKPNAVLFGKILSASEREALVWDIERGVPSGGLPFAWQTDTCIGSWHYSRSLYERNGYKSAKTVVQMLADIVSKNGNLLLNIPLRGDGTFDEKEQAVLEDIASWMDVNKEAIFGTRPWAVFGEGPASTGAALSGEGFNEGKGMPFTAADVRFTAKDAVIYAIFMDWPGAKGAEIHALGKASKSLSDGSQIKAVSLLGSDAVLEWSQDEHALKAILPAKPPCAGPIVLKIITAPASRP
jgi:alpha-L-fucosidase